MKGLDNTLASALKREDAAHRTVIALSEEILLLQSALEIKESEIRKHKLIAKFKDDKIQRLEVRSFYLFANVLTFLCMLGFA